jgi:hypothetical protein
VTAREHTALYAAVRREVGHEIELPASADALEVTQRRALGRRLRDGWPTGTAPLYEAMVARVAAGSADHWRDAIGSDAEAMLWRLLRIGSAPYFVLGTSSAGFLRLRVATPWDWRRNFELRAFDVQPRAGGQPMVDWRAVVRERTTRAERIVAGHVEVRWSHGRFAGRPEAKVYLDTAHAEVPGYFPVQ